MIRNREFMKRPYKNFKEFIVAVCCRELHYFFLHENYTKAFSDTIRKITIEMKDEFNISELEFIAFFNSEGNIAIINDEVVGEYIADSYINEIKIFYRMDNVHRIINKIVNGTENVKSDFVSITYKTIFNILNKMYKDVKYRKEVEEIYKQIYELNSLDNNSLDNNSLDNNSLDNNSLCLKICSILILEDICKYLGVDINRQKIKSL